MKRGPKPKGQVKLEWTPQFAYAIGLITADGYLSKDGRHIDFTSKDIDLIETFQRCIGIHPKISPKLSGNGTLAYHTQFGDVLFYQFMLSIGLLSAKSSTLGKLLIPEKYFFDFIRGYFDGDGSSYSYFDPTYVKSFRFYLSFTSASAVFIDWLRSEVEKYTGVRGHLSHNKNNSYVQLKYAKKDAILLSQKMYYSHAVPCLRRKHDKILASLSIIESCRGGETGRRAAFRAQ